ncbi:40S ribosomal protein S5-1 [Hordeum vulgare]|nr:40S ribosomal protein S5-1 [Hordeum vulgare]
MAESSENAAAAPAPASPAAPAPATVPSPAPKTSPPASSGIPPRYDLDAKWDACLDLSIRRVAYSSLAGAFWGLILFLHVEGKATQHANPVCKDKIFEKVINPYLAGVLQHPQSIEMHEGMFDIRDVEGSKMTGSMEARLEAMEQQVFKCQGLVERGLNANHMIITEFTNKHKIDANDIGKHLSRLYDRIDHLQAQIYDLQNQNCNIKVASNNSSDSSSKEQQ